MDHKGYKKREQQITSLPTLNSAVVTTSVTKNSKPSNMHVL